MVNIRLILTAILAAVLIALRGRVMFTRIETTGVDWIVAILALAIATILFITGMICSRKVPSCVRR